jgi:hypothetical protein
MQEVVDQQQLGRHLHCHPRGDRTTAAPTNAHLALLLLAARPDIFARQGSVVPTWRRRGTRTYGPYYRLSYRDAGRQQSLYLGRAGELVQQVRRKLDALQNPLRQRRALDRLRRHVSASLQVQKTRLDARLRPFGLRLQGFEVRGWRTSPLRRLLSDIRRFRGPRRRQLRLYPKGRAAAALRKKKSTIPRSPKERLEAVLAARRRAAS